MMKIAIVGYNLFGVGGTSRSNINLISELLEVKSVSITYYNTRRFTISDVSEFKKNYPDIGRKIKYRHFSQLVKDPACDTYILTRESLFVLSKSIKQEFPKALVIGEVHAPLPLIAPELDLAKEAIDVYRVSTERSKQNFSRRIGEYKGKIVPFPVSVKHIRYDPLISYQSTPSKNLYIYSRFDEISKDISYAIRLMDYIVNYLEEREFKLYLKGSGPGITLYRNLIKYYHLNGNVFINREIPSDANYLSTSRNETFGYSISEAFTSGQRVILYGGDDHVLKDIYGDFTTFGWLTKNIPEDAKTVIEFCQREFSQSDFRHDIICALKHSVNEDYGEKFIESLIKDQVVQTYDGKASSEETYRMIYSLDISTRPGIAPTINNYLGQKIPKYRKIISSSRAKQFIKINSEDALSEVDFKLRNDFVFIESFHGKSFTGDPKYLALAIKEKYPEKFIYVSSVNQLVDIEILNFGFYPVRLGSSLYISKFRQSKYVITNGNTLDRAGKQEGQIFIETWHGFPLKKMVHDLENEEQRAEETAAFLPRMMRWDYLLSSSEFNTKLISSAFMLDKNEQLQILEYGAPRNEYLINNRDNMQEFTRLHQKYFNRPYEGKTYILFCPTWRKDTRDETTALDLAKVVRDLPDNYEIIVKLHPNEGRLRSKYSALHSRIHCFYNELVDIQELYILCQVLITDFSSAMFDFAHMNRKIIVLQEDADSYNKQVGWYFDSEELVDVRGMDYPEDELVEEILLPSVGFYNHMIVEVLMNQDNSTTAEDIISEVIQ